MSNNRKQQINSFLNGVTQEELNKYILENKLNKDYTGFLKDVKNNKAKNHVQKISDRIFDEYNINFTEYINNIYKLGQSSIISLLLNCICHKEYDVKDVKKCLKIWVDNDTKLKEYVYDLMKDY